MLAEYIGLNHVLALGIGNISLVFGLKSQKIVGDL